MSQIFNKIPSGLLALFIKDSCLLNVTALKIKFIPKSHKILNKILKFIYLFIFRALCFTDCTRTIFLFFWWKLGGVSGKGTISILYKLILKSFMKNT